ncbi:MAG TPA: histidinol phosphate phosphatase [Lachnospiraceae bacterium]|nr:histidinol phosphate phosphatase [Lachnospiraceae bacterium]
MIRSDCHVHTSFSADSSTPMEEQIRAAIRAGIRILTFTEHEDLDFPYSNTPREEWGSPFLIDIPSYRIEYERLKKKYEGQIELLLGCELGLAQDRPDLRNPIEHFPEEAPFDFVIGSTHAARRQDPYFTSYFDMGIDRGVTDYFVQSLRNVQQFSCFDSYGHLDYVLRYAWKALTEEERQTFQKSGESFGLYYYEKNRNVVDEILKTLAEKDKALEVNTQGLSRGYPETNPCAAIVRRFREFGGQKITVGTDAHTPDLVGTNLDAAEKVLLDAGFQEITIFSGRVSRQILLNTEAH